MFDFLEICGKLILSLTTVLILIFLVFRVLGSKVNDINNKKYMKIIDRLQITKDNSIVIVQIGKKAYIMSSSAKGMEKIEELEEEELQVIDSMKKQSLNEMQSVYNKAFIKLKGLKGDKHER
jgi:flagellar protein FliO/FliZ